MNDIIAMAAAASIVGAAFMTDIRKRIIPNALTIPACIAGFPIHALLHGWEGFMFSAGGTACGFAAMFTLFLLKGIGAGDVKLFAALGSWVGLTFVLQVVMCSILFAGVVGLVVAAVSRGQLRNKRFPFMIAVLPAFAAAWAGGTSWI